MIPNQAYFSKSRVRDTKPYPPNPVSQNFKKGIFRTNTFSEHSECNWLQQNFKENHCQQSYGYATDRYNEWNKTKSPEISNKTHTLPIHDFSKSAVSRYPAHETCGKSKSINKRVSNYKPKRKDSTKSVNNLPLFERLKNVDYPASK